MRGIKKEELQTDFWLKETDPSRDLRKWYTDDPETWEQFQAKYFAELDKNTAALEQIVHALCKGTILATCLKKYLEKKPFDKQPLPIYTFCKTTKLI